MGTNYRPYFCFMMVWIKKYKAFFIGVPITFTLFFVLQWVGFIRIDPHEVLENAFIFTFWWLLFSLIIHHISFFKKNKVVVYKSLGLIGLLALLIAVDSYFNIPNNPATILLIILFWMGVVHLVLPRFFRKYKVPIIIIYGILVAYLSFIRLHPAYADTHHEQMGILLLPLPLLLGLWIFEQWKWLQNLKAEKGKAELALLKSQINPHFFFNTLNNLYGLTVEKSDQAPEVVLKLSDMMRYTIYQGREDLVSLKEEAAYLQNYIDLHRIRYQKDVTITFEQEVADGRVAPLLFIILLENAFKHGVERLTEGAYIHLQLKETQNGVRFEIENNCDTTPETPAGIGLTNLQHRLQLIYPHQHQLTIDRKDGVYHALLEITTA